jgi:hypothetical protein
MRIYQGNVFSFIEFFEETERVHTMLTFFDMEPDLNASAKRLGDYMDRRKNKLRKKNENQ